MFRTECLPVLVKGSDLITGTAALIERATRGNACWWGAFASLCIVLILPLFVVDIPPLTDYPNHLAREYVLAFGAEDPHLSQMYAERWGIIPNLAIDLVMPAMMRVLPLYLVGKIVMAFALVLPVTGVAAYSRAAFGSRSFWPLASGLVAFNGLFLLGFLNFQIGLGLALLGGAGWIVWRDRRPVALSVCMAVWGCGVFFAHIFGLLFLVLIIGGWELDSLIRSHRIGRIALLNWAATALRLFVVFAPAVALCLLAPIAAQAGDLSWLPFLIRVMRLLLPLFGYDILSTAVFGAAMLTLLYLLVRKGAYRMAPGARWTMFALLAGALLCPFTTNGTGFVGDQFAAMLGFMLFAGSRPVNLPAVARSSLALILTLVFAFRLTAIATVWYEHNADVADMRQVIAPVPAGGHVLVVSVYPHDNPTYWQSMRPGRWVPWLFRTDIHLPALLLIERHAFWPLLFTASGKQPLVLLPPYDRLDGHQGVPPEYHVLEHPVGPLQLAHAPYLAHWQSDFEYVLLLNAGGAGDLDHYLPDNLQLVARRDAAALFRIVR